jgi:23S rRNA (uracil1939-C5)-methyltransferase
LRLQTGPHLAAGGDAVARASDGRVVFIAGAAPDELVEVEVVQENKTFLRARVVSIVEPSERRVNPPCKYYGACGGCTLQHVDLAAQTASKVDALLEALRRIGHVDTARLTIDPPWSGQGYGYRSRVRFAVDRQGHVGFRARSSNEVIDIDECLVLAAPLQLALASLHGRFAGPMEIEAVANAHSASIGPPDAAAHPFEAEDGLGPLLLCAKVFSQANREGNIELVRYVEERVDRADLAVELFSGSGNLTRAIARRAKKVLAFEADERAVELAEAVRPDNVEVRALSAEEALGGLEARPDLIVVDPPRTGLERAVLEGIGAAAPQRLIYVSCDPSTFARDCARLGDHALALERVRLLDLYPQTAHIEVVGALSRSS